MLRVNIPIVTQANYWCIGTAVVAIKADLLLYVLYVRQQYEVENKHIQYTIARSVVQATAVLISTVASLTGGGQVQLVFHQSARLGGLQQAPGIYYLVRLRQANSVIENTRLYALL